MASLDVKIFAHCAASKQMQAGQNSPPRAGPFAQADTLVGAALIDFPPWSTLAFELHPCPHQIHAGPSKTTLVAFLALMRCEFRTAPHR